MIKFLKGSLAASFFIILCLYCVTSSAQPKPSTIKPLEIQRIANHKQWHALLHLNNNQLMINDPTFILSLDNFSPENELLATLDAFRNASIKSCKFIARHQFLSEQLENPLPAINCPGYSTFKNRAPLDDISVLYASENLTQPSSMMGHTMLAISGMNQQGIKAEHAVSFFTELDNINLVNIFWETLYKGKPGYFTVQPIQKALNFYLVTEQRNIWRYRLRLDAGQKSLLHKHLWELKFAQMDYLFHRHNCATLSLHILKVAAPYLAKNNDIFVSPIDVAKAVSRKNLIVETLIYPSSKWKIRMLSEFVDEKVIRNISQGKNPKSPNDSAVKNYLNTTLSNTYAQFQYEQGDIEDKEWFTKKANFSLNQQNTSRYKIDIENYQSPLKTPDDSHLAFGYIDNSDNQWLTIGWLPASHDIADQNSEYFGENELKLNEVVLNMNTQSGEINLQRWQLYSAKSLIPYDTLTGGVSGDFNMGFDQILNKQHESNLGLLIYGGIGKTYKMDQDLSFYYLANIGSTIGISESYAFIEPEVGAYLYELWDMKTLFSLKHKFNSSQYEQTHWSLKQSFMQRKNSSFIADLSHIQTGDLEQWTVNLQFRNYY